MDSMQTERVYHNNNNWLVLTTPPTLSRLSRTDQRVWCWKNPLSDIYTTHTPSYFTFSRSLSPCLPSLSHRTPIFLSLSLSSHTRASRAPKLLFILLSYLVFRPGVLTALWGGIVAVVIVTSSYRGSEGPRLLFASCSLFSTTHFTAHHDTQQTAHYCKPDTALQHATESKLSGQQALPHKRATPEIKQQTSLLNTVCVGT